MQQTDLLGDVRPVATDQLFFALYPDAATAARIDAYSAMQRAHRKLRGKPHALHRLHITLFYIGGFAGLPQGLVDDAVRAVATLRHGAIPLRFDTLQSFSPHASNKPLVLTDSRRESPLRDFQTELVNALARVGIRTKERDYELHITLLYDEQAVPPQPMEPIEWMADRFLLVDSLVGHGRHVPLGTWPLGQVSG